MGLSVPNVLRSLLLSRFVASCKETVTHSLEIDAALKSHWLERAKNAPLAESLKRHREEEETFIKHMNPRAK